MNCDSPERSNEAWLQRSDSSTGSQHPSSISESEMLLINERIDKQPQQHDILTNTTIHQLGDSLSNPAINYPSSLCKIPTEHISYCQDYQLPMNDAKSPPAHASKMLESPKTTFFHNHLPDQSIDLKCDIIDVSLSSAMPQTTTTPSADLTPVGIFWKRIDIEIVPGHNVPLLGSDESWHAFKNDNVIPTECSACQTFLYCIDTASMVICPSCRMVSPLDQNGCIESEGLGLGLSVECVFDMLDRED